jgi:hypothetical protein
MEQWLLQTPANKILDVVLLLSLLLVSLGTIYMFLSFIFKKNKDVAIQTPFGSMSTSDKNRRDPSVNIHVNSSLNKGLVVDENPAAVYEEACEDGLERYEAPKGTLSFKEHKFFKLMAKALKGRVISLKSRYEPTELQDIKNKAFSYFLFDCKTKVFNDMIEEFVDDCLCQFGNRQIVASIIKRTMNAIIEYEDRARKAQVILDKDRILLGIPEVMITRFNTWHQNHVNITLDKLETIIESQFYPSWQLKLICILDTFETIFSVTFEYAEYSLMELNGELDENLKKNIVYRSIPSE